MSSPPKPNVEVETVHLGKAIFVCSDGAVGKITNVMDSEGEMPEYTEDIRVCEGEDDRGRWWTIDLEAFIEVSVQ